MIHSFAADEGVAREPQESAILLIDDDQSIIPMLEVALRAFFSIAVYAASSPNEARSIWREHQENIIAIMSDIRLGTETGIELVRELTREREDLPVVFMTGHAYTPQEIQGFGRSAGLLLKPFNLADIRSAFPTLPPRPGNSDA